MRRSLLITAGLAATILAASWARGETELLAQEVSLKTESKVQAPGKKPGFLEVTYTLVNTSTKPIVGWNFGCAGAAQNGQGTFSFVGYDDYLGFEEFEESGQRRDAAALGSFLLPGERTTQVVPVDTSSFDGPFAGMTCGVAFVIFGDLSIEGAPNMAETFFRSRAGKATDSYRAYKALSAELERGNPVLESLEKVTRAQHRSLAHEEGVNLAVGVIEDLAQNTQRNDAKPAADWLLNWLRVDYERGLRHLPADWQARVMKEDH
jgi:hypothetical protein